MLKLPDRPSDAPRSADESPLAGLGAVFSALDDAVALVDRPAQRLRWTSRAWQLRWPSLRAGSTLAEIEQALPGLGAAARAAEPNTAGTPRRLSVGPASEWEAELAGLDPGTLLLRLTDRREQSRALQRQLDDREQLLFTSRVISVGEMASTLAHELNQPIGAAANLMRGLRKRLARCGGGLAAEESEALDRAIDQVMFASRIIARIREFTHSHQPRQARVDFSSLLRSSASLLDWDLRRTGARLALEMPDAAVLVRGDAVMLQQVVVNLMRNALDALRTDPPEDPRLTLRLLRRREGGGAAGERQRLRPRRRGGRQDVRALRLQQAQRHGPRPVDLPLVRRAAPRAPVVQPPCRPRRHLPPRPAPAGSGARQPLIQDAPIMNHRTVYIVDDNAEFRESTRFWLSGCGFDVQTWGDPCEAVDALARRERRGPACLILDVRMPQLSGLDVHDSAAGARRRAAGDLHERPRRCAAGRAGDAEGRGHAAREAVRRRGAGSRAGNGVCERRVPVRGARERPTPRRLWRPSSPRTRRTSASSRARRA